MEKVNYKLFPRQVFKQAAAASAKSLPSCPTRCDRIDGSPPGSPIPGNLQARILEWVAISFSNACKHAKSLQSDSETLWTIAHQAPLSMGFSRQEYWSGLPFSSPLTHWTTREIPLVYFSKAFLLFFQNHSSFM